MSAPYRISRTDVGVKDALKEYLERLMKMIPGEIIALYLIGSGFIPEGKPIELLIWSIFCLVCLVIVRAFGTSDPEKKLSPQWNVVVISSIAYIIWIYTLGGVFKEYGLHVPRYGSLLVLVWTFIVPYLYKGSSD